MDDMKCPRSTMSHNLAMVIFACLGVVVSAITLWYMISQFKFLIKQYNDSISFMKYDNFKYYNKIYDDWYDDMPNEISMNEKISFSKLNASGKAWIRRYFDLYSQEYYLFQNKMLPDDAWDGLIHGCNNGNKAAFSNIKKYPALLEGYVCWKKEGAFSFPEDFKTILEAELVRCQINIPDIKDCN